MARPPSNPWLSHSRLLLAFLSTFVIVIVLLSLRPSPEPAFQITPFPPQIAARRLFITLSASANASISSHLRALTLRPHLAGTPSAAAAAAYVRTRLELSGLDTLTRNYSVLLSYPAAASLSVIRNGTLIKALSLTEPADSASRAVPPYHSYSPSGSVIAPAVYANLGRDEDYLTLDLLSVDVRGCVVVVRKGGGARGAVVEAAGVRGAKAVLMFGKGVGGGVERGTVLLSGPGDPLTPGWAASSNAERLGLWDAKVRKRFPKIPSMPIPTATATEILGAIGGPLAPPEWKADLPAVVRVGGGSTMLNFTYQIGSTEWVEQNLGNLGSQAVVYLNLDCAVQGAGFFAGATPQLDRLLMEIMKQVRDPDSEGMTVYQTWAAKNGGISVERLARADSDFTAFLHHAGVPATDIYFGEDYAFYHTILDTYDWMEKYGDPSFRRHVAISEIWGLLSLRLADDPILPFDYNSYAGQLQEHTNSLATLLNDWETVNPIRRSIAQFSAAAKAAQEEAKGFKAQGFADTAASCLRLRALNDRLMLTERAFLEPEGLCGRPFFKHVLYSPPKSTASKLSFFPGIADAIYDARSSTKDGRSKIDREIWRVARAIQRAASVLGSELA